MVNTKHAFWQALVFTIIIFFLGIVIGFFFEVSRSNQISNTIYNSEVNLLDQQLRTRTISDFNVSCSISTSSLFAFADTIYLEAQQLDAYDSASNLATTLDILYRRYDLMRVLLWSESTEIRTRCHKDFHTAVYLYTYHTADLTTKAEQTVYSRILEDIKSKHGSDLLLIPIATDMNLTSVDVLLSSYNITSTPAVLIDEKRIATGELTEQQLEQDIFKSNN
jgi:hypothetical protein